jgi:hypothetical protein
VEAGVVWVEAGVAMFPDTEKVPGKRPLKMKSSASLNERMALLKKVKPVEKWSDVFNEQHSVF